MSYCTIPDVQGEFKGLEVSASSIVTTDQVNGFIAQADAYINSRVGLRYQVPLTGTESLLIVKQISARLVAQRIKPILAAKNPEKETTTQAVRGKQDLSPELMLEQIVENKLRLSDATLASSADGVRSFAVDSCQEHVFKKGVDQW